MSGDYYATFERPNVELITEGVRELTKSGVVADDGTEREADVVVLSTGFESTASWRRWRCAGGTAAS